uniref:Shell mytilin-1 n=1 Tax=Mytilus coruscus TaxID=42192 RepID=A0A0G2YHY0_MYTCO|nr:shell mytilin-1 [Mytilus coruscus]
MISIYCWFAIVLVTSGTALANDNDSNKLQNVKTVIAIGDKVINFHDHTTECIGELMCVLAALPESERNKILSTPLGVLHKIATDKGQDRYSLIYAEAKKLLAGYPTIEHVLNAAANGHSVKDHKACASMYSKCPYEPDKLLDIVNDLGDITKLFSKNEFGKVIADALEYNYTHVGMTQTHSRKKRSCFKEALDVSCESLGATCGLMTVGCAVCTFFSFGTCIAICGTVIAGSCGTVIAGCGIAELACPDKPERVSAQRTIHDKRFG